MKRGLEALGHRLELHPLWLRTGFHTLDRWLYNASLALRPPRHVDLVYGVDLDGFLLGRRRPPLVVSLKGVIADELKNERGLTRLLLSIQARWERRNVKRADVVIACSRYSCEVARREYGVPEGKLVPVPEPIDLEEWDRRFAGAPRRPRGGRVGGYSPSQNPGCPGAHRREGIGMGGGDAKSREAGAGGDGGPAR